MCISNPMSMKSSSGSTADSAPIKSKYDLPPELVAQEAKKKKRRQKSLVNFADHGGDNSVSTGGTSSSGLGGTGTGALGMDLG